MECFCGGHFTVYRTVPVDEDGNYSADHPAEIIRYRKCRNCGATFRSPEKLSGLADLYRIYQDPGVQMRVFK